MKAKPEQLLVSALFPQKIIDESAETIQELCEKTGLYRQALNKEISRRVKSGVVEQVWKKSGRNLVPAYRIKK